MFPNVPISASSYLRIVFQIWINGKNFILSRFLAFLLSHFLTQKPSFSPSLSHPQSRAPSGPNVIKLFCPDLRIFLIR
jgi:hypothetical protein